MNKPRSKYTTALLLILILLLGLTLRLRLSQDQVLHQWDERFHALVAKNLIDEPFKPTLYKNPVLKYDHTRWYENHVWLHKQPLPLWLMALGYKTFGINEFVTRLPSLILSCLLILVTFILGKDFFSKKTGLLAAFFVAINGLIIEIGAGRVATDHYDLQFMVFITMAVLFAWNSARSTHIYWSVLSGLFIGFALITKWLPCLIVLPVHFLFLRSHNAGKKQIFFNLSASVLSFVTLALPWQIYILNSFPLEAKWEYYHHWLHVAKELDGHQDDGFLYYLNKIRMNYSEIVYLPLIYFIVQTFLKKTERLKNLALLCWIFVPIIFFSFAKTKMQGYILFISPALFMITADFFFFLKDEYLKRPLNPVMKTFSYLVLAAIIVLPIRYCYERTGFGLNPPKTNPETAFYKNLSGKLPAKTVVLNVKHPIEFMFYTDYTAYSKKELSYEERKRVDSLNYAVAYLIGDSLVSE